MKSIVLIIVMFLASQAGATSPANYNFFTRVIKIKVNSFIQHPGIKGQVTVNYSVSSDGSIVINKLESTSNELDFYVRSQLKKVKIYHLNGQIIDEEMISRYRFE